MLLTTGLGSVNAESSGKIKEIVSNDNVEYYVENVKEIYREGAAEKLVIVDVICKLKGEEPDNCPTSARLRTLEGAYYFAESDVVVFPMIPVGDIVRATFNYAVKKGETPAMLSIDFGRLEIDLTTTKNPQDPTLKSDWKIGSNKGVSISNGYEKVTVKDETISGNSYSADLIIKNIGVKDTIVMLGSFYLKDQDGYVYEPPLSLAFKELKPDQEIEHSITFSVKDTAKQFMIIYFQYGYYMNTGTYIGGTTKEQSKTLPKPVQVDLSKPTLIDQLGNAVSNVNVGDMVGIESEIKNSSGDKITFAYIVQIKNSDGITIFLTWVQNLSVLENDSVKPAVFWLADHDGNYQAEVFVWLSVSNPIPLAPVSTIKLGVGW
jgi:hypothetical protein